MTNIEPALVWFCKHQDYYLFTLCGMFAEALEALCIVVFGLVSDYFLFLSQADCNCRAPPTHSGSCVLPSRVGDTATKASVGVVFELALWHQ